MDPGKDKDKNNDKDKERQNVHLSRGVDPETRIEEAVVQQLLQ